MIWLDNLKQGWAVAHEEYHGFMQQGIFQIGFLEKEMSVLGTTTLIRNKVNHSYLRSKK